MIRSFRGVAVWCGLVATALGQSGTAETWSTGYTGTDANGSRVIAYWRFDRGAETADSSGKGHTLSLAGATTSPEGRMGGALVSFSDDQRHAAIAAARPTLSPKGAFTLEMWIKPKPDLPAAQSPVLIDKQYVARTDYQWRLSAADRAGARHLIVSLGFGDDVETYRSDAFQLGNAWQHLAFSYDGAGEVRFFRNGAPIGQRRQPGRGAIAAGVRPLSIGDRGGSNYAGFAGTIDEVRLCEGAREFRLLAVSFETERKVWRRMESSPAIRVFIRNLGKTASVPLTVQLGLEGLRAERSDVPALAPGARHEINYRFDTSLRPDTYRLIARVEAKDEIAFTSEESCELVLTARPPPNRMPVVMWGINGTEEILKELPRLQDLGFTHCLGGSADMGTIWAAQRPVPPASEERIAATKAMLDTALAHDFGIAFTLSPGHWLKERKDLQRVDRAGQPYARGDVNAALPGLTDFAFNVGASIAQTYQAFPAWQAALIDTEVRDSTQLSFSAADREAYRKFAGAEIPADVPTKRGVDWHTLKNFPPDRVIADDDPVRRYLLWFWTVGDGWNALHSAAHRGIHSTGRDDVWTWFDPTIRAPSVGGSGGTVDVLSQWTYTNPDPLRIGYFADELFAMADVAPQHPRVMKMTQLFWYRTQSAPKKAGADFVASPFDDHDPDAAYITIAPVHLRESFWTKLARPVQGIMYHGWQALVPTQSTSSYRYTHPDTKEEFRRLHRGIIEPLGPTLRQIGDPRRDVAYLDSFTAQMFAGRGSYGYGSEEAYLTLLYAQLQPEVIFEETLVRRGLGDFRVLVLADCDVLPASVVERIREFQRNGGIVVGDENLAPAIKPSVLLPKMTRQKKADVDHAKLLANAAQLRAALRNYERAVDSSEPEIVTRLRTAGEGAYVFVVNDRRDFGTYVGQHGLVMENGVPASGTVSMRLAAGTVYDLVAGRPVTTNRLDGRLAWPVQLAGGDGGVFLAVPRALDTVKISAAENARLGSSVEVDIVIADDRGAAVVAVIPVQLDISDPAGRRAEFSGYYGAKDGQLRVKLDLASNDRPGIWQIRVRELASGLSSVRYVRVTE